MNVIAMTTKVLRVANAMIRESSLPNFFPSELHPKRVRVSALDELDCAFQRYIVRRSQQQMHMLWHQHKSVQKKFSPPPIAVQSFQEKPNVRLDHKNPPPLPCQERHKISSRRRHDPSRLQKQTSAAGSRNPSQPNAAREWNSCPSQLKYLDSVPLWERRSTFHRGRSVGIRRLRKATSRRRR
jgi:hypothetical protein